MGGEEFVTFLEFGRERGLEPMKFVDHESQFSVYFSDPCGHAFELTTYDHKRVRDALK